MSAPSRSSLLPFGPSVAAATLLGVLAACSGVKSGGASGTAPPTDAETSRLLFDGKTLAGWHADVPSADGKQNVEPTFVARDGVLVSRGKPEGHLITDDSFRDYRLVLEWRWPETPGNNGILVH